MYSGKYLLRSIIFFDFRDSNDEINSSGYLIINLLKKYILYFGTLQFVKSSLNAEVNCVLLYLLMFYLGLLKF